MASFSIEKSTKNAAISIDVCSILANPGSDSKSPPRLDFQGYFISDRLLSDNYYYNLITDPYLAVSEEDELCAKT